MNNTCDLTSLENNILRYEYSINKLLFQDNRSAVQECVLFPKAQLVCDWSRKENNIDVQVVFPLTAMWEYNHYLIFIYDWAQKELFVTAYRSHTKYPPVWDRGFSLGPDWIDYVGIQHFINKQLKAKNLPEMTVDESKEGKSFNASPDSPEKIQEAIKEGKPYNILSLKAEAVTAMLEKTDSTKK